jgi:hypothetical protein
MKGNQWKTTGGSWGFLNKSCRNTLITTLRTMNDSNAVPTSPETGSVEHRSQNEPRKSARKPMLTIQGDFSSELNQPQKEGNVWHPG